MSSAFHFFQNTAIDKLTEAQIAIANFDINTASAANSSAPVLSTIEQKQQRANTLILKYMNDRNYVFTDAEKAELRNMANECEVKGDYVTHARNLLDVFTLSLFYMMMNVKQKLTQVARKKSQLMLLLKRLLICFLIRTMAQCN